MQEMEPKYFNKVDDIWLMDANLKRKENIEELMMEWQSDFEDLQKEGIDMNVLELLRPHRNLKRLIVALRISALSRL